MVATGQMLESEFMVIDQQDNSHLWAGANQQTKNLSDKDSRNDQQILLTPTKNKVSKIVFNYKLAVICLHDNTRSGMKCRLGIM